MPDFKDRAIWNTEKSFAFFLGKKASLISNIKPATDDLREVCGT